MSATYGTTTVAYQYDGTGRRTERIVGTTTEHDYYSGQQEVETSTYTSGTLQGSQQYVWSPLYVDTPIVRDSFDSSGNRIAADRLYYTTDANHNVTAVTDSSGAVVERYAYTAYGDVTVYAANWSVRGGYASSTVQNTRLFGGMELDPLTGAYYDKARWYNSTTGDFLTTDPAKSDPNLYRYCSDNPVIFVDPSGRAPNIWNPYVPPTYDDKDYPNDKNNPAGLSDGKAGYSLHIEFTTPTLPSPTAEQYQANHVMWVGITSSCKREMDEKYIIDGPAVVESGTKIIDNPALKNAGAYCFYYTVVEKHMGIVDKAFPVGLKSDKAAYDWIMENRAMPGDLYYSYTYVNPGACKCCSVLQKVLAWAGAGERLKLSTDQSWIGSMPQL